MMAARRWERPVGVAGLKVAVVTGKIPRNQEDQEHLVVVAAVAVGQDHHRKGELGHRQVQDQGLGLNLGHQQERQQPNQNHKENRGQNHQVIGHHQGQDHHHPKEDPDHQVQSQGHHHQCLKRFRNLQKWKWRNLFLQHPHRMRK